ncbi:MAG: class IV adenylate cyclase [Rhodospirillales bacterium]
METEIKLAVSGTAEAKRLLRAAGLRAIRRRVFEVNTLFDTAAANLRKTGQVLRVRQCGRRVLLTYKGPPARGSRHKSREELETEAGDAQAIAAILSRLGFEPVFRYEKYRTEYTGKNGGVATLDETPIGVFLELEGAPGWIDRTAARLGFTPADYITASYARLYLEHRKRNPRSPKDMVFSS